MKTTDQLFALALETKGFMPENEGLALFRFAQLAGGPTWLELGAWCGKSAIYLGAAAQARDAVLFSLDHHHGSEENQRGWAYFDEELVDPFDGRLNTLPTWQHTIAKAELEETVVGLIGPSEVIAPHFSQPLDLFFLDGGHAAEVAWRDYRKWAPKLRVGGVFLIHDVFADPADGGRPPFEIYEHAMHSDLYEAIGEEGSLRALRRVNPPGLG